MMAGLGRTEWARQRAMPREGMEVLRYEGRKGTKSRKVKKVRGSEENEWNEDQRERGINEKKK